MAERRLVAVEWTDEMLARLAEVNDEDLASAQAFFESVVPGRERDLLAAGTWTGDAEDPEA